MTDASLVPAHAPHPGRQVEVAARQAARSGHPELGPVELLGSSHVPIAARRLYRPAGLQVGSAHDEWMARNVGLQLS